MRTAAGMRIDDAAVVEVQAHRAAFDHGQHPAYPRKG
jgi:hypothetical protein